MFDAATFATHISSVDNAVTNQEKGNSLERVDLCGMKNKQHLSQL